MTNTRTAILNATRVVVLEDGYAALTTRKVAELADVPLSQIHYHFGSKQRLVAATLDAENTMMVERQTALYDGPEPLSEQWSRACDYLDADLASGYVRILQELTAAGWSDPEIKVQIQRVLASWQTVLTGAVNRASKLGMPFGPLSAADVVALTIAVFVGAESMILSGAETDTAPIRDALRSIGRLIGSAEEAMAIGAAS